jgi:hypothetical protein
MASHDPIEYWAHPAAEDPDAEVAWVPGDDPHVRVTSTCEACHAKVTRVFRPVQPAGTKGVVPWDRTDDPVAHPVDPATFVCACDYPHANRPAGNTDRGCGAYWQVRL